jgi:hypothetical protein
MAGPSDLKRVGGVSEEEDEIWEEVKVVATSASIPFIRALSANGH